ncbi:MAG: 3'-5' exonuclease [Rectinema sp.]
MNSSDRDMSSDRGAPIWARFASNPSAGPRDPPRSVPWFLPAGKEALPRPEGAPETCPLPYDWDRRKYMAFDFETTGLDASTDRVLEAGLVLFRFDAEGALVVEDEWSSLVNPGMPIPDASTAIHGITDLEVSAAPRFSEIADEFSALAAGRVLLAHNANFDMSFLQTESFRAGKPRYDNEVADSLAFARMAFPGFFSFSLGKLAYRLEIDTGSAHRALDDARTCMHIFVRAARILAGGCP